MQIMDEIHIEIAKSLIDLLDNNNLSLETYDVVLIKDGDEYLVYNKEYGSRIHGVLYRGTSLFTAMEFLNCKFI